MRGLSFRLFKDTELLMLVFVCLTAAGLISLLFRFLPFRQKPVKADAAGATGLPVWQSYRKKDWYYVTLTIVFYAIVSLWQLGSPVFPVTTWQPSAPSQSFVLVLDEDTHIDELHAIYGEGDNNANLSTYQLGFLDVRIEASYDLENWQEIATLSEGSIYRWEIVSGDWNMPYYRVYSVNPNMTLTEIGFKVYGEDRFAAVRVLQDDYADSPYPAELVIDEQETIPLEPTYYDQSFFDEVYHPRNAWEIAMRQHMYATVHPLLGTSIMALFIRLFGMSPFIWRLPGALFGIFMVPLMYAILHALFGRPELSAAGTAFLALDFMHITTSRIGTLEPFSVFFILLMYYCMIRWAACDYYETPLTTQLFWLLLCGLATGLGMATKWTACYSAVGLAVILFATLFRRWHQARQSADPGERKQMTQIFTKNTVTTILLCFVFFIFIPLAIYILAYTWTPVWRDGWSVTNVWNHTKYMYNYHANLDATHPYQSTWYMWLLDIRPIWYYSGTFFETVQHTIACFSNPILCWCGFIAAVFTLVSWFKTRSVPAFIILAGYLSALLPWVAVDRCIFAYHFYPTSMFMFIAMVYMFSELIRKNRKWEKLLAAVLVLAAVVFVLFLPVTAGFGTSLEYIHMLEWLPSWYFG